MKIAIIAEVFFPKVDGVVIRTMNLIRHLIDSGDEVLVICPAMEGRDEAVADLPCPVVECRSFPFPSYPEYRIGLPDDRVAETVRQFAPDVLHYLNPFAFGFRCRDLLERAGIELPSLFSFHTLYAEFASGYAITRPLSRLLWRLMRDYHNRADRNLTVSGMMVGDLVDRGFERVELWPPAVNCSLFNPSRRCETMRERLSDGRPNRPLLLTVSRLAPEKNVGFLANVMRRLPEARLAIIGDGPDRGELERTFAGTESKFFGYLTGEELATAYASADAFVYASETETMGNVILEAMASGLPVIAPRAGGIPSLVEHERIGLLFAPGEESEAVAAVSRVLTDPDFRVSLSDSARITVEDWGWNRSVERVREHYRETINREEKLHAVPAKSRGGLTVRGLVLAFRVMSRLRGHRILAPSVHRPLPQPTVSPSITVPAERTADESNLVVVSR